MRSNGKSRDIILPFDVVGLGVMIPELVIESPSPSIMCKSSVGLSHLMSIVTFLYGCTLPF